MEKVLIGSPVSDRHAYCIERYLACLDEIDYPADVLLVDNSKNMDFFNELSKIKLKTKKFQVIRTANDIESAKMRLVECRNILREEVIKGYDWFLNLEQDVIPPADVLKKLLSHNKKAISAIYYNIFTIAGKPIELPILYGWFSEDEQKWLVEHKETLALKNPRFYESLKKEGWSFENIRKHFKKEEVEEPRLLKIKACGMGCLLIHRSVLEKVAFRFNPNGFDDVLFCLDARKKANIDIYADIGVKCLHLTMKRPWEWQKKDKEYIMKSKN